MADVREQRIYCAEQIVVPQDLPSILKAYSKEVIRNNPENIIQFSANYFKNLISQRGNVQQNFSDLQQPDSISKLN